MIRSALAYAGRLGLAVFPVAADCRRPLTPHGVKDAATDPEIIRAWWTRWPDANIAVAAGNGRFVLDIDQKGADGFATLAELEMEHGPLPETWTASTPNRGRHVWFTAPDGRQLRNRVGFRPGLDVRTDGGSVAVPPSRKTEGVYSWTRSPTSTPVAPAPAWLIDLIDPPVPARPPTPPIRIGGGDRLARYVTAAVEREAQAVATTPANTGRNARLFQAAANLGELVGAGVVPQTVVEAALEAAAHDAGLVRDDGLHSVRASIRSGLSRGLANPREVLA
jgi:uncharacterized protein YndB with AHSA1/START domain